MRKFASRAVAAIAMTAGLFGFVGATQAFANEDTTNTGPYPSVEHEQEIWNQGGAEVGSGAAKLISAAWVGIPAQTLDYAHEAGQILGATN